MHAETVAKQVQVRCLRRQHIKEDLEILRDIFNDAWSNNMVIDAVRKALIRRGITTVELSWILQDNAGMRHIIETIGGVAYKRYRIDQKD